MKIFRFTATASAVALLLLASCSKDDKGNSEFPDVENQTLSIRIAQSTLGRSVSDPAAEAGQTVTFSDGNLLLTKSNGEILYVYNFVSSGTTDVNNSGTTILISDAVVTTSKTDGVTIENISGDVSKAYIVGNTGSFTGTLQSDYASKAVVGENISSVQELQITPAIEFDSADKGLAKATLYGEGNVVTNPTQPAPNTGNLYKLVEIDLYPHVARVELSDITGKLDITEFHVNGIYINNYYPTMSLNFVPATIVNQGQGGTSVYDAGKTVYTSGGTAEYLYDSDKSTFFNNQLTTLTKVADGTDAKKLWAYNVLAAPVVASGDPMFGRLDEETTLASQIIVQVQGVKVSDGSNYDGMKYITVNKLYEEGTSNEITHFKAGYIYTIEKGQFAFEAKNVKDEANLEDIDLQVLVKPITWTVQKMTPGLQ